MQWLTLVPEDAGVRRLKTDNQRPTVTGRVDPVSPYPTAHADRIDRSTEKLPNQERRQRDRRRGERRQKQVPVLLDTRGNHDRRGLQERRKADTEKASETPVRPRINVYA